MRKQVLLALAGLLVVLGSGRAWAQGSVRFTWANNPPTADADLYVASVGIDPSGNHSWVNPTPSQVLPRSSSYNTVAGPTYGSNAGPNLQNNTAPNQYIVFETMVLPNNQYGFLGNTARVGAFQHPMGLEPYGNGYYRKPGELKSAADITMQGASRGSACSFCLEPRPLPA